MGRIRFGWAQIVLGLALLACAAWLGGPAWIVAWPAIAVIAVGIGYLGVGPRIFGKRDDGSLHPVISTVLLPYHVVAFLRMHWDAVRHAEAPWHRVADGLYLGRRTPRAAMPADARVVVDLTAELPRIAGLPPEIRYHVIPTLDATAPAYEPFAALASALADEPAPIFVHCAAGHGRSAAFAAALVVARGLASDAIEAERLLQRVRPLVRLHREQREVVDRFARARGGQRSVAGSRA
ncbi:MAG: tyrosine-protein phosphatase [Sandaracinus sp.]